VVESLIPRELLYIADEVFFSGTAAEITPVKSVEGADITTLEGLGTIDKPHPLQQAFIAEQAAQCGFCVNGVIMTAKAFLDKNPKASDQEIQQAMSGVLCRCFTHVRMMRAIFSYRDGGYRDGRAKEGAREAAAK